MNNQYVARSLGDWLVSGSGSVSSQLIVASARAVEAGLLPGGMRLPPERELAVALAVSGRPFDPRLTSSVPAG